MLRKAGYVTSSTPHPRYLLAAVHRIRAWAEDHNVPVDYRHETGWDSSVRYKRDVPVINRAAWHMEMRSAART